jgi:hypothetical protein
MIKAISASPNSKALIMTYVWEGAQINGRYKTGLLFVVNYLGFLNLFTKKPACKKKCSDNK